MELMTLHDQQGKSLESAVDRAEIRYCPPWYFPAP